MVGFAMLQEQKITIPTVRKQLEYLASMQENVFWVGIDLNGIEDVRLRLRRLTPSLDKKKRKIVDTNFQDEILGVRSLVGMERVAANAAFSEFLSDRSLSPPQIRFIEMVIDQLTARGVMEAAALYEPPFSNLSSGGPEELFAGKENVIDGIFEKLKAVHSGLIGEVG